MLYMVSYELNSEGQDYPKIVTKLKGMDATRILHSQWLVRENDMTAEKLYEHLLSFIDSNDKLVVIEVRSGSWVASREILNLASL